MHQTSSSFRDKRAQKSLDLADRLTALFNATRACGLSREHGKAAALGDVLGASDYRGASGATVRKAVAVATLTLCDDLDGLIARLGAAIGKKLADDLAGCVARARVAARAAK